MKRALILMACLSSVPSFAQQPNDDMEMARNQFMVLFGQCDTSVITLKQQSAKQLAEKDVEIAKLKAEIQAPKSDPPKAQ